MNKQMKRKELTKTFYDVSNWKNPSVSTVYTGIFQRFNPFKPEFIIVIFIHYKRRIAVAILNL